jgi:DNA-binding LacI/PurR family transcriptional regulator
MWQRAGYNRLDATFIGLAVLLRRISLVAEGRRVTLADVAAASGVSQTTASFVLRDSPGQSISAATRDRVRQAAKDLGYVPHGIARALREGTSRIVVLVIDPVLEGNYARSYVRGLDAELTAHGHALVVRYEHAARDVASGAGDGLGAQDSPDSPDSRDPRDTTRQLTDAIAPRAVLRFGEPYLTGRELDDSGGGWRDGLAAHVAAQLGYLAERGHRHIALALPDRNTPLRDVRQRFADKAAGSLGLPPPRSLTVPGSKAITAPSSGTSAADTLSEFRARHPEITAVAAFDDDVALRVLAAMRQLGLSAPGDLAVIGFDDNGYGALTSPTLSTVRIDAEAHGRQAALAILGLESAGLSPAPGQVVARESA